MEAEQNQSSQSSPQEASVSADNHAVLGVLSYIGPLVIISFIMGRNIPFVKFHVKQGLVLLITSVLITIFGSVQNSYAWSFMPLIQLLNLGVLILAIIGIINVLQKKEKHVPLIGHFANQFKF